MRDLYEGLSTEAQLSVNAARSSVARNETTAEAAIGLVSGVRPSQRNVLAGCLTVIAQGRCHVYPNTN
jgi:hypothetical protein